MSIGIPCETYRAIAAARLHATLRKRDELDVNYEGEGMVIGFNYQYLLDVLNVVRGETVGLELSDEFSPTVLTSPAEPGALFVVMPMRI